MRLATFPQYPVANILICLVTNAAAVTTPPWIWGSDICRHCANVEHPTVRIYINAFSGTSAFDLTIASTYTTRWIVLASTLVEPLLHSGRDIYSLNLCHHPCVNAWHHVFLIIEYRLCASLSSCRFPPTRNDRGYFLDWSECEPPRQSRGDHSRLYNALYWVQLPLSSCRVFLARPTQSMGMLSLLMILLLRHSLKDTPKM